MTRDYRQPAVKNPILSGQQVVPINSWCQWCRTECHKNFEGTILVVAGLNNSLHASEDHNLQWHEDRYISNQVVIQDASNLTMKVIILTGQNGSLQPVTNKDTRFILGFSRTIPFHG